MQTAFGMSLDGCGALSEFGGERLIRAKSKIGWNGEVICTVRNRNGVFLRQKRYHNIPTNYALSYIASIVSGAVTSGIVVPSQIELGTGSGTPDPNDTALWVPSAGTLQTCSIVQQYLNTYAQFTSGWQPTDPIQGTWTEAGLFDVNGNMWAHTVINQLVNSGEMLTVQWSVGFMGVSE